MKNPMKKLTRNKTQIMAAVVLVTLVSVTVGIATAQNPGSGKGKGPDFRLGRMAAHLELTDQQQASIKALKEDGRSEGIQVKKELARLKNQMEGEMLKDVPSEKTVLSLNEKMGALKTELKATRLKTRLAVRELLTPEQRDKMLTMRGNGRGREGRGEGRSKGHRGGREFGRGMGQCDGSGPHSKGQCPQNNQ